MYVFLGILLGSFILYILVIFVIHIIHGRIFYKRFVPDANITYYTEEEFGCKRRENSFKVGKLTLKGCFITPNKEYDKSKIIVFCHGMGSSKESYMQDISTLANGGFEVFCFDYIGVNESEGNTMGGFAQGLKSVDYAIKYIHSTYPEKDIYVMGHSWGGFNAVNSVRYNPYVKKICALAPFLSINDVVLALTPFLAKMFVIHTEFVEGVRFGKYAYANSISTLKKYQGEALIIHSEDDDTVIYDASSKKMLNKFKEIRINNTLAEFDKRTLNSLQKKMENVKDYAVDLEYSEIASILLDGKLKAASKEYMMYVYDEELESGNFNKNILNIESLNIKNLLHYYM